jgi:hypothetical protein
MKHLFAFLLVVVAALGQQTRDNFNVKTNLIVQGTNILDIVRQNKTLSDAVMAARVNSFIAVGDSHTEGRFASVQVWTDADRYMFEHLKWPNIVATNLGLGLTNRALSGTFMNDINISDFYRTNSLTQLSVMPLDYSGLIALAHGYNDGVLQIFGDPQSVQQKFWRAEGAIIGRVYAQWYTNPQGKFRDGTSNPTFSTTGTVVNEGYAGMGMFPVSDPATAQRIRLDLLPGQTVTFTATNPFVWFQPNELGNQIALFQGTNMLDMATGYHEGYDNVSRMFSHLKAPGMSGTFTVTNISGTNMILAVGAILNATEATNKIVGVVSPNRLASVLRNGEVGVYISQGIRQAASDWSDYPVFYCDWANAVDTATVPSNDTDHPNPAGQRQMADAFLSARKVSADLFARNGPSAATFRAFQILGNFTAGSHFYPSNGISLLHEGGISYIDSSRPDISSWLPFKIRASEVDFSQGPAKVAGAISMRSGWASTNQIPVADQVALQHTSGSGYLDSFNWNGANTTYLPLLIRAIDTDFPEGAVKADGPVSSRGTWASASYIPLGDQVVMQTLGGYGYLDVFNWNGSTVTYLPMYIRTTLADFNQGSANFNGAISVRNPYANTNQIPIGNQVLLSYSGTQGELTAANWNGATTTYTNLAINAAKTDFSRGPVTAAGPVSVRSTWPSTAAIPIANQAVLAMQSGVGYVQSFNWNGSSVSYLPLNIESSGLTIKSGAIVEGSITVGASGSPTITGGSGVPSSSQPNGSLYLRADGTGPNLYVRENGVWVAK